ncbi:hypothetical protein TNCT_296421 [Trichonephila clavata]|uniref:Uncharacterized protein n=1 Tax=Trichonephila clavata TaxID=2740835 RepID=A0A8X6GAX6_TRICU|nr:hypothetical protein TNCT_296421 [Trichonephila clavata]
MNPSDCICGDSSEENSEDVILSDEVDELFENGNEKCINDTPKVTPDITSNTCKINDTPQCRGRPCKIYSRNDKNDEIQRKQHKIAPQPLEFIGYFP